MNTSSGKIPNYYYSNSSSDSNGSTTDAHHSTSLSDDYDVQFVFVSDEEMSCGGSFLSASQLPFWWLERMYLCQFQRNVMSYESNGVTHGGVPTTLLW